MSKPRISYYFRSSMFRVSLFILALLTALLFQYLSSAYPEWSYLYGLLYSLFLTGSMLYWYILAEHRVVHKETLRMIRQIVLLCLLLHMISRARADHYGQLDDARRFLRYLSFVPINFIPVLMFLLMLTVGKKEGESFDPRWRLLFLPATVLSLLIVTNDRHQMAFLFPQGIEVSEKVYQYGLFYFLSMGWAALLLMVAVMHLFYKGKSLVVQEKGWVVFIPLVLIILNTVFINYSKQFELWKVYDILNLPDTTIIFLLLLLEMCIELGMIPSNSHYQDFFEASTLSCQIVDEQGHGHFYSNLAMHQNALTKKQKKEALQHPLFLDENTMLWGQKIKGGASYWTSNVSEVSALLASLRELSDSLTEENTMIQAENELAEETIRIEEMNRIYDRMLSVIRPTLFKIDTLLAGLRTDSPDFEDRIKQAAVYGAYVKRRCNLTILSDGVKRLSLKEIEIAIQESLHYMELLGINGAVISDTTAMIPVSTARLFHETFEALIETFLTQMDSILVSFRNQWEMRVVIGTNAPFPEALAKEINANGEFLYEDGAYVVTVREGMIV